MSAAYFLRVRRYASDVKFLSVWLIRRQGAAESGLLFGDVLPAVLAEIATVTGLQIENEDAPFTPPAPLMPAGCAGPKAQAEMIEAATGG